MKLSGSQLFKTVLTFDYWPCFTRDNSDWINQRQVLSFHPWTLLQIPGFWNHNRVAKVTLETHNVSTKSTVYFWAIMSSNHHKIQQIRTVLKNLLADLKTILTFEFWLSKSWDIEVRTHKSVNYNRVWYSKG